jgi:hypothetical protein
MDKEINEEERVSEGGYEGRRLTEVGGLLFFKVLLDLLVESLSSVVGKDQYGGTGLLGVLGTRAKISIWYPGARKPDRLLLAGREEPRFGKS